MIMSALHPLTGSDGFSIRPGDAVSHHPAHRETQMTWARGVLASPAQAADDAICAHACRILIELSRACDHTEAARAADLLRVIEGEGRA